MVFDPPMRIAVLSLLALASSCHGPKGSPDSSIKSYYAAAASQDYEGLADTVSDSTIQRLGSRARALQYFEGEYAFWKDTDVTIDDWSINGDGQNATVRYTCFAHALTVKYKQMNVDCSDTWSLVKQDDDKWHIVLPGAQRLRPIQ